MYLAGHSLGAQPSSARAAVEAELDAWARLGVDAWFEGRAPWIDADDWIRQATARIVGARPAEVATMNTLTVNLHVLLASFYRPERRRRAILIDAPTFPSDRYAVESHVRSRGLDPGTDLIVVQPAAGEALIPDEHIAAKIHDTGDALALTLLAGVNYASGQARDIGFLTAAAHQVGAVAMWDLAHAAGNVPLTLHADGVDAAAWCTYKYLNSGPGALGQVFIHEEHLGARGRDHLGGWWGNDPGTRFEMSDTFRPAAGADGWRVSTPPILSLAPIRASLEIFDKVGVAALRDKSVRLTGFLEALVRTHVRDAKILTPTEPEQRGVQLSIRVADAKGRLAALAARGVIADHREPDIIRLAPVPLYNTFRDAWAAAEALAATSDAIR